MANESLKFRHLAELLRAEKSVATGTRRALNQYVPIAEAAVAAGTLTAFAETEEDWTLLVELFILPALLVTFRRRYASAGGRQNLLSAEWTKYTAEIRPYLLNIRNEVYKDLAEQKTFNTKNKVEQVSRTQTVSAYNAGLVVGLEQIERLTGVQQTKMWLSMRDGRVRLTHQEADGQTVPMSAQFFVGGFAARYPGAPELPAQEAVGCRCVVVLGSMPLISTGGPVTDDSALPNGWRGPIAALDRLTGDGRMLVTPEGGVRFRQYPMSMTRRHVGDTDIWIGTMDRAWVQDGDLWGEGSFDLGGHDGREAARQLVQGLETVSIHPDEVTWAEWVIDSEGKRVDPESAMEFGEDGSPVALKEGYSIVSAMIDWRLASVAVVSIPAYDEARIEPVFDYQPTPDEDQPSLSDDELDAELKKRKKRKKRWPSYDELDEPTDYSPDDDYSNPDCECDDHSLIATIVGNTSHPVFKERKRKWDGHKARINVAKWASSDGSGDLEKINWTKFGSAFLYRGKPQTGNSVETEVLRAKMCELFGFADEDAPPPAKSGYRVEDFKLGFIDIIDGKPYIVANALIGIAGGHGVTATKGIPEPEVKAIKKKLCLLYGKARSVFPDFPDCPFAASKEKPSPQAELIAASGQVFHRDFFDDPNFDKPTPLTVVDGQVFGHVALWDSCYMSFGSGGSCTQIPRTKTGYSRFHVHGARLEDGSVLPVGALTFGEGHRSAGGLKASQRLYADVATIAAKVRAGEDEFGVWVAGEVVDAFRDRADDLLLSPLSGHWEPDGDVGGALEMLAAHVVVTPGFKVPRLVASVGEDGEITALQASFTFLEKSAELFDDAVEAGDITPVGERDDGVVLYDDVFEVARARFNEIRVRDARKRLGV